MILYLLFIVALIPTGYSAPSVHHLQKRQIIPPFGGIGGFGAFGPMAP
jgi:hypothetical protein